MSSETPVLKEPTCINLRERFGDRYRIGYDPACAVHPGLKRDPWYFVLPCKHGEICPNGADSLRLDMHASAKRKTREIREKLGAKIINELDSDEGMTFIFPVSAFDQIADIVQPRKRRVLTLQHREHLTERLRKYREER